jgi:hypothetical protein
LEYGVQRTDRNDGQNQESYPQFKLAVDISDKPCRPSTGI